MKKFLFLVYLIVSSLVFSQENKNDNLGCFSTEVYRRTIEGDREIMSNIEKINHNWGQFIQRNPNFRIKRANTEICIVFNVLSNNKNFDLAHASLLTSKLNAIFSVNNSTGISFKLADIDDSKKIITDNSIFYTAISDNLSIDNVNSLNLWSGIVQSTNKFPTTKYINIYLVDNLSYTDPLTFKKINVNSFSTMPAFFKTLKPDISYQGIYLKTTLFDKSAKELDKNMMYFVHEMGHYLGLYDTYGICKNPTSQTVSDECGCVNEICFTDGDMVCDTPPTKLINSLPKGSQNSCSTDIPSKYGDQYALKSDVNDLLDNYMHNYSVADVGVNKFTPGQIKRMNFFVDKVDGVLNTLIISSNCNKDCASDCKVIINPIDNKITEKTSPFYQAKVLLKTSTTVNYSFTGNTCGYSKVVWTLLNLNDNTSVTNSTGSFTMSKVGNYKISLTCSSISTNGITCTQNAEGINFQVLEPAKACNTTADNAKCCEQNLYLDSWSNPNWNRIKYENGWAKEDDGTFSNSKGMVVNGITYKPTLVTNLTKTASDDNFELLTLSDLKNPTYNLNKSMPIHPRYYDVKDVNSSAPINLSRIFKVGKTFNDIKKYPVMKRGDASFLTYTFKPTKTNAKIRVYYMGVKEVGGKEIAKGNSFIKNIPQGSGFGVLCEYTFKSVDPSKTAPVHRGMLHSGPTGLALSKNDLYVSGDDLGVNFLTDDGRPCTMSDKWMYKDLDFSDFICNSDASITLTFFARTNNSSDLGFINCYAYFGVQCFPADYQTISLNLPNVTSPCQAIPGTEEQRDLSSNYKLDLPKLSIVSPGESYEDLLLVSTRESNVKSTIASTPFSPVGPVTSLNLKSSAIVYSATNPYTYTEVQYKTACQTKSQVVSFIHDFNHKYKACEKDGGLHGGKHVTTDQFKIVGTTKYVEFCEQVVLKLGDPCFGDDGKNLYVWTIDGIINPDLTNRTITLTKDLFKKLNNKCLRIVRMVEVKDNMCGIPSYIPSDEFVVTCLAVQPFASKTVGPNVCAKSETRVTIKELSEPGLTCDPYFEEYFKKYDQNYKMTIKLFKDKKCTLPIYTFKVDPITGQKVETNEQCQIKDIVFHNGLGATKNALYDGPFTSSTTLDFINDSYTDYYIYAQITTTRQYDGCPAEPSVLPILIPIKPSSIPGQIGNFRACPNEDVVVYDVYDDPDPTKGKTINPNDPMAGNQKNYDWEYKVTEATGITPAVWASLKDKIIPNKSKYDFNLHIKYSDFLTLLNGKQKLTVRRLSPGTVDCPQRFYSNELDLYKMKTGSINASVLKTPVCYNYENVLINASKAGGDQPEKYVWTTTLPIDSKNPIHLNDPLVNLNDFVGNPTTVGTIKQKTTYYVMGQYKEPNGSMGCYSDPIELVVDVKKLNEVRSFKTEVCKGGTVTLSTSVDPKIYDVMEVTWNYSYTDDNGKVVNGSKIVNKEQPTNTFTLTNFLINYTTKFWVTCVDEEGCSYTSEVVTVNVNLPDDVKQSVDGILSTKGNVVFLGNHAWDVYLCGSDTQTDITAVEDGKGKTPYKYQWYIKNVIYNQPNVPENGKTALKYPTMKFESNIYRSYLNTHYLVIKDANGCESINTVTLKKIVDGVLSIGNSTETICNDLESYVELTANVVDNSKNNLNSKYDFKWSTNELTNPIKVKTSGNYSVTATNKLSKCTLTGTKTIAVKLIDFTLTDVANICPGKTATITLSLQNVKANSITKCYWVEDLNSQQNDIVIAPNSTSVKFSILLNSSKKYSVYMFTNTGCMVSKPLKISYISDPKITYETNASKTEYDVRTGTTIFTTNCENDQIFIKAKGIGVPKKFKVVSVYYQSYFEFYWKPSTLIPNPKIADYTKVGANVKPWPEQHSTINTSYTTSDYTVEMKDAYCSVTEKIRVVKGPKFDFEVTDLSVCPGGVTNSKINVFYNLETKKYLTPAEINSYTVTIKQKLYGGTYTQSATDKTSVSFGAGVYDVTVTGPCGTIIKTITVTEKPLDQISLIKDGTKNIFDNSVVPKTRACDKKFENISVKICSNVDLLSKNLKVEALPCEGGDYVSVYWNYTLDENGCLILNFNPNKRAYTCVKRYRIYGECTNIIYFDVDVTGTPGITINSSCAQDNMKHLTATSSISNYSSLKWIGYSSNEIDVPINLTKTYTVELIDPYGCSTKSTYDVECYPRPTIGLRNFRLINKIETSVRGAISINSTAYQDVKKYFDYYKNESGKVLHFIDGQIDLSFWDISRGYLNPLTFTKLFYKNNGTSDCSLIPDGVYLLTEILPTGEVRDLNYYDDFSSTTAELSRSRTVLEVRCGKIIFSAGSTIYEFKEPIKNPSQAPIGVNIFPNPSNGDFEIVTNHEAIENYKIVIYDLTGKEIYTKNMIDQSSGIVATQINLSNNKLANGLYSVKVFINDEIINQKIQINN
jgi:hypothetical protein